MEAHGGLVTETPALRSLTTPRAAAWAGVLFAVLFGASIVRVRTTIPSDPFAEPNWLATGAGRLRLAMSLLPFAGLAFLWFTDDG